MATDWALIRRLANAAIDACEATDRLNLTEADRSLPTGRGAVVVSDVLITSWTYPENVRYGVIRARHALADDAPYKTELARTLTQVAAVCAELVGASRLDASPEAVQKQGSIRDMTLSLVAWYEKHMLEQLSAAAAGKSNENR